jgi:hypothetical protein
MDNLVALVIVLSFVAALMALAALWFYVLAARYAVYGLMRLSAALVAWWLRGR